MASNKTKTRYAVVGLGGRSTMFTHALLTDYRNRATLAALCDINQIRMDYYNKCFVKDHKIKPVPTYRPDAFDRMIKEQRIDKVIVTSIDRTHHRYIIRAMQLGCDVISEKPMTVDAPKCQAILDTVAKTKRKLTVTFNYRYAPHNRKIKELLSKGVIGNVLSVHFEWLLDTNHGADYFRRWHRDKRNSGGLMVHKATHHFDLINWYLDSEPETVFGFGKLGFYGRENAEERGETRFYQRAHGSPNAKDDPFALHMDDSPLLKELYLKAEVEDGYQRDQSVFGDNISIEDDMSLLVRYRNNATMTYHLTAYSPWEGYRIMFNGTGGRLECTVNETPYVSGAKDDFNMPGIRDTEPAKSEDAIQILVRPLWKKPVRVPVETAKGGHGGGDVRLLEDVLGKKRKDPLKAAANHIDGAMSIMTGICANRSFETGLPVKVSDLITID